MTIERTKNLTEARFNICIDKELKENSEKLFRELGMTLTQAVRLYFKQCVAEQGIPFKLTLKDKKEDR